MALRTKLGTIEVTRIKAARVAMGWSLRDLARNSGVSLATVQRAEVGKELALSNALSIARVLKYPVEELWENL